MGLILKNKINEQISRMAKKKDSFIEFANEANDKLIAREKFIVQQAIIFLGAEVFVLFNMEELNSGEGLTLILSLLLKISILFFALAIATGAYAVITIGYLQAHVVALRHDETEDLYDQVLNNMRRLQSAISVSGNAWVLGWLIGLFAGVIVLFLI